MTQISIRLPEADTTAIDELVEAGQYPTRSAFVAAAVRDALALERERQVVEQYRRAYSEQPLSEDEAWVIEAGHRALARLEPYE